MFSTNQQFDYECNECRHHEREVEGLREEIARMRAALEALKHGDGCYCEASFAGPGCHPSHSPECQQAINALSPKGGE